MEAFIMAIVLVTALVIGSDHNPVDPEQRHAIGSGSTHNQSVDRKHPAGVCDPDHQPIIQRDLTRPGNRQVNDDDR